MFTCADKGERMFRMNKDIYVEKAESLLNDRDTYKIVKKNPLNKLQTDTSLQELYVGERTKEQHEKLFTLTHTELAK